MSLAGIDIAVTGINSSGFNISVIGNNIANLNSDGFKSSTVQFQDLFYGVLLLQARIVPGSPVTQVVQGGTVTNPLGVSFGAGVQVASTFNNFTQGPIVTGLDMDVAINGEGFFRVTDARGNVFYTRNGAFQPKADGATGPLNLQLPQGPVTLDPPIVLPGAPGVPSVNADGQVFEGTTFVGQMELVRFRNPDGLLQVGDLLFAATDVAGPEIVGRPNSSGFGVTVNGSLESSNVDLAGQLVNLLQASQAFGYSSQSLSTGIIEIDRTLELARQT